MGNFHNFAFKILGDHFHINLLMESVSVVGARAMMVKEGGGRGRRASLGGADMRSLLGISPSYKINCDYLYTFHHNYQFKIGLKLDYIKCNFT